MHAALRTAQKAAASDVPVLIEGPPGVGKELLARAIHGSGVRRSRPFVAVRCGAISDNLVESLLLGDEKAVLAGTSERPRGKFVEGFGGTLFLDDVAELPSTAQVSLTLLDALEPALEVTVHGDNAAERLRRSAQAVKVVETEAAQSQSADLGEVLARNEGVSIRRSGGLGTSARVSLNGLSDDQLRALAGAHLERLGEAHAGCPIGVGCSAPSPSAGAGRPRAASSS